MLYRRRVITRERVAALGYVYVVLGLIALVLGADHGRAASAVFTLTAFAYLWFVGSLRARIIRSLPAGSFASVFALGASSSIARRADALAARDGDLAARGAGCAATVGLGSS